MTQELTIGYKVGFYNFVDVEAENDEPIEVQFEARDPKHVKIIISALAAFYSGDPCVCYINGKEAVLDRDWGLLEPENLE